MPTRLAAPVLTVDAGKMHEIDTRNVENLFSMWTVFNRCAESMGLEGRRLENLSWRLWNRATFCCEPRPQFPDTPTSETPRPLSQSKDVPELSSSAESLASEEDFEEQYPPPRSYTPPVAIRGLHSSKASAESLSSSRNHLKPISSQALQSLVMSIKETNTTQKPCLPASVTANVVEIAPSTRAPILQHPPLSVKPATDITSDPSSEQTTPRRQSNQRASQSSTSTAPFSSPESNMERSHTYDSQTSAELIAPASVVRGFGPHAVSSSQRLHAPPTSAPPPPEAQPPKPAPVPIKSALRAEPVKTGFMVGCGSSGDESSVDDKGLQTHRSSLTAALRQSTPADRKQTSFRDIVESRTIAAGAAANDEAAIASDDEDDEDDDDEEGDVSESAIEDEEDSSDWEDSVTDSGPASPSDRQLFQRVDSKPNLVSRRSLLTTQLHQSDRASAMASLAQRGSQPALRRSRPSAPSNLSIAATPSDDEDEDGDGEDGGDEDGESALEMPADHPSRPAAAAASRARPIMVAPSNTHQPALSPRTTRRNMLASELTESLRKELLHERQQKTTMASVALKRRHTAHT